MLEVGSDCMSLRLTKKDRENHLCWERPKTGMVPTGHWGTHLPCVKGLLSIWDLSLNCF